MPKNMKKKILYPLCVVAAIAVVFFSAGFFVFYSSLKNIAPPPEDAVCDAAVVLTGGRGRLQAASRLMADKFKKDGRKLLISGINKKVSEESILKIYSGIPPGAVLGYGSDNTLENAIEAKAFMQANSYDCMYLITSDYHMARAALEFSHLMPGVAIIPYPVKSPRRAGVMVSEYFKYLNAMLRIKVFS